MQNHNIDVEHQETIEYEGVEHTFYIYELN